MAAASDQLGAEVVRRWPAARLDAVRLSDCASRGADEPVDLYLASAAAGREAWALETFEREIFVPVRDRLARRHGSAPADEALQRIREQLLVGADGLKSYSGRGPLKAWVTVIAARRLLASRSRENDLLDAAAPGQPSGADGLELALLRARYASVFKQALQRGFASLERRQRLLLRMHTVDGLSAAKIGAVFHAHRATASEWLVEARAALHEAVTAEVQREAGLSSEELDSIGRVLQRHTDFSLPRLLAGHAEPAP